MVTTEETVLIHNAYIVTMDSEGQVYPKGFIKVQGNKIIDIGPKHKLASKNADKVIDATGKFVLPGFINAHTHGLASLLRARGAMLPQDQEWHQVVKWPFLEALTPQQAGIATMLTGIECLLSGATTVVDQYYPHKKHSPQHADAMISSYHDLGIRCGFVRAFHEENPISPAILHEKKSYILAETERLLRKWHHPTKNNITIYGGPDNLLFTSLDTPKHVSELLERYGSRLHSHVAESREVEEMIIRRHGGRTIELLRRQGLLRAGFQAVHVTDVNARECEIIGRRDVRVVHCPATNMIYGEGVAPIGYLLSKNIAVGIGTDCSGTYNGNDMFVVIRLTAFLHRLKTRQPSLTGEPVQTERVFQTRLFTPVDILRMATVEGAKVLGINNITGSLELEKRADIIVLDPNVISLSPIADPVTLIVYHMGASCVDTVMVDGEILVEKHRLTKVEEAKAQKLIRDASHAIFSD
ncbi:MAG: amidohydrolase family protein [Candidatus Ranarchaeia archaeon]